MVGLVTLGWCHGRCGINRLEQTTLGYSHMSGYHLCASFAKIGGEMKHSMPWECGPLSSLFG